MKVLIINNFNNKLIIGGVENYLLELKKYSENNESKITYEWYGSSQKKTNWIQKFYNYKSTKEINQLIDKFNPDLIHCFSIGAPVTPHFMKHAKTKNIPILYSFRDYYYICPKNYMLTTKGDIISKHKNGLSCIMNHHPKRNFLYDTLLHFKQSYHKNFIKKYVNYFLTPSNNLTKSIKNHFNLSGETLHNPTMLEVLNNELLDGEYLLYVGRLDIEKGVMTLLKAYKNILSKFPNEKLLIVGEGNQMKELLAFKNNNNLHNVTFIGKKRRKELTSIYQNSKFVIIPSEFLESYCNVVLESFAFKKTVIVSNLLGITKDVIENNSGLVFPFRNIEKLTESIELLLIDINLRRELANNGLDFAEKRNFKNHFNKQIDIYLKLIKKPS